MAQLALVKVTQNAPTILTRMWGYTQMQLLLWYIPVFHYKAQRRGAGFALHLPATLTERKLPNAIQRGEMQNHLGIIDAVWKLGGQVSSSTSLCIPPILQVFFLPTMVSFIKLH
ncbi:hypothetical protein BKA82DRAFT_4018926 [Pisolithus tinctorius]|nr:hypothetical protein BKA82DRAFT_4018926 [Pisolithus tinctorius]